MSRNCGLSSFNPSMAPFALVRAVSVQPGYRLSITCNDGTSGGVDMSALVNSTNAGIYAALKDAKLFQQVSIELGVLTWPNGADLDPVWVHEEIGKNKTWSELARLFRTHLKVDNVNGGVKWLRASASGIPSASESDSARNSNWKQSG